MKKILVIGSLNMDFSINVETIPLPGETVNADNLLVSPGGKGANQAYTIGKLGGNVSMLGILGKDIYGKELKNNLKNVGVNVKNIKQINTSETGKAFITVSKEGENSISIIHGANYMVTPDFIEQNKKEIEKADIILMQLEIPLESVKKVLEIAKDKTIILDPAPADKSIMDYDLSNVFLIKPNETELSTLTKDEITDENSIVNAARKLTNKGVKFVIVSMGSKGCYLITKEEFKFYPAVKSNTVDTTAAGDSFIASITLCLSKDMSLEESINFASKVASIVVTKKGAQNSIPNLKEII